MQPQSPTQTSGKNLSGSIINRISSPPELGSLLEYSTNDGSFSLYSTLFKESFHSRKGALLEAKTKFISPSQLNRAKSEDLHVLDVCMGLGYNSAALMEEISSIPRKLSWWGLELDRRPLVQALKNQNFNSIWSSLVLTRLEAIRDKGCWKDNTSQGEVLWGDARCELNHLPSDLKFELIMHDAFSPQCCPQLWSEEFITSLAKRLAPQGRLVTYCRAAAVRASMKKAGLKIFSLVTSQKGKGAWSEGTLAILPLVQNTSSIIMTVPNKKSSKIMNMNKNEFNTYVSNRFENKLGNMKLIDKRYEYSLVGVFADRFIANLFALIGDAAVGMHPVTAHGFNLGLRGQNTLALEIKSALMLGLDIGSQIIES